jgi:hypothetical protein
MKTKRMLRKLSDDNILNLPLMYDTRKLATTRIMILMFAYSVTGRPRVAPLIAFRLVQTTVLHGMSGVDKKNKGIGSRETRYCDPGSSLGASWGVTRDCDPGSRHVEHIFGIIHGTNGSFRGTKVIFGVHERSLIEQIA